MKSGASAQSLLAAPEDAGSDTHLASPNNGRVALPRLLWRRGLGRGGPPPFSMLRGDTLAGCRTNRSGLLAENDDLLSLPLSSKGGEGKGAAAGEPRCV